MTRFPELVYIIRTGGLLFTDWYEQVFEPRLRLEPCRRTRSRPVSPPGWPAPVRPPGAPDWETTATAWLLDLCPPEYRTYPALRRHPVVLARFAVLYVEACQAAVNRGSERGPRRAARGGRRAGGRGGRRDLAARVGAPARRTTGGRSRRGGPPRTAVRGPPLSVWTRMPRIAVVFLVDARGHVLLQHRDEHAPRAANQWGMVGGHVEDGEDFDERDAPGDPRGDRHRGRGRGPVPLAGDRVRLLRRAPQRLPGVRRQGRPDRRRHRGRRGSRDRLRRPGRHPRARPGRVDRALPAALPRRPTSTAASTKGPTDDQAEAAPDRGARDGRRGRGRRRPRHRVDRHRGRQHLAGRQGRRRPEGREHRRPPARHRAATARTGC